MKIRNWVECYCSWLEKNYLRVLLFSSALSIVGFFYTIELYKNLRTDIEELLPESAQSVIDLKKAGNRVSGMNHLEVVIESENIAAAKQLQLDLTEKFKALPLDVAAKTKSSIREERLFFQKYEALYIDLADWVSIGDYIKNQKKAEAKKAFSLGLDDEEEVTVKKFDFKAFKKKYEQRLSSFSHFRDDLFQSKNGKTRIILVFLAGKTTGMKGNQTLSEAGQKIIDEIQPSKYAPDMKVGLGGDVQNVVEEHHGLVHDLITSFLIVTVAVTIVLLLYYRSIGAVIALSIALFGGVYWTFGLIYFLVGYLNANTAFLGSIVIGNGINCGIIFLARYLEERQKQVPRTEALPNSILYTARPTFTASLAAGLSYGSLVLTNFRGFNQFGIIGALGMFFCWISAYTFMPALLIWFEKKRWIVPKPEGERDGLPLMRAVSLAVLWGYKTIAVLSFVLALIALVGVARFSKGTLESDLSKLRNLESMLHGSGYWGKKVDDAFNRSLTPTVVLTQTPEENRKLFAAIKTIHEREGAKSPFFELNTVEDILPTQQAEKKAVLAEIDQLLTPKLREKLTASEKKLVEDMLPARNFPELKAEQLPVDLLANFKESDGRIGTMIHVYPRLNKPTADENGVVKTSGTWNGEEVIRYTALLREAIQSSGVDAVIAGQPPISADMLSAISRDGPKATGFALAAVVLLVVVMFPKPSHTASIVGALLLGVLWMTGVMGLLDWKINFLNFITLPITFGIGVDYAVNILGRFYEEKGKSITAVIAKTGGAVVLCSSTTIIGYSSLLLSGSQAFVSFGRLAVLGEFTCILAAVISLPAIWLLFLGKDPKVHE